MARELIIKFHGEPGHEHEVSINYSAITGEIDTVIVDFMLYYSKVLFCLGKSSSYGEDLVKDINRFIKRGLKKGDDLINDRKYTVEKTYFVEEKDDYTKICKSVFPSKTKVKTKFSRGGENYYTPISVVAFLQYIINNVAEEAVKKLNDILKKVFT